MGTAGFEPAKPKRLIYSQVGLAIPQRARRLVRVTNIDVMGYCYEVVWCHEGTKIDYSPGGEAGIADDVERCSPYLSRLNRPGGKSARPLTYYSNKIKTCQVSLDRDDKHGNGEWRHGIVRVTTTYLIGCFLRSSTKPIGIEIGITLGSRSIGGSVTAIDSHCVSVHGDFLRSVDCVLTCGFILGFTLCKLTYGLTSVKRAENVDTWGITNAKSLSSRFSFVMTDIIFV